MKGIDIYGNVKFYFCNFSAWQTNLFNNDFSCIFFIYVNFLSIFYIYVLCHILI